MFPADLLHILLVLVIVGLALWAISQFPIDAVIARVIRVVVVVLVAVWLVSLLFGALGSPTGLGYPYPLRH